MVDIKLHIIHTVECICGNGNLIPGVFLLYNLFQHNRDILLLNRPGKFPKDPLIAALKGFTGSLQGGRRRKDPNVATGRPATENIKGSLIGNYIGSVCYHQTGLSAEFDPGGTQCQFVRQHADSDLTA